MTENPGPGITSVIPDPWTAAMRRGDFAHAWRIGDAVLAERLARGEPLQTGPRHLQCVWNGRSLAEKRVLVRCYHGLGDTVQFVRFAAPLRRLAREVIVWAQPPLVPLVATASGVDRVLPLHDGVPDAAFDADIEIMELAHALRVDHLSIADNVPYLFSRAHKPRFCKTEGELSVGLVWHAGGWDPRRSIPLELLAPLAHVSGARLLSLQRGRAAGCAADIPAHDVSSEDVEVTAATLLELDLLISVDTFAAHLAGALGISVWLLLHSDCDWRWMANGSTTVWYPTMRLFRQRSRGNWLQVIGDVKHALSLLIARST